METRKLKLCDKNGFKIDSAVIQNEQQAEDVWKRWKRKGLF